MGDPIEVLALSNSGLTVPKKEAMSGKLKEIQKKSKSLKWLIPFALVILLAGASYVPTISVTTKKIGNLAQISIKDNSNGVPQKTVDKIFQPFFTTKPTGQGTGLGLSLCYDIIKTHGREISLETEENEGSNFIISLPLDR